MVIPDQMKTPLRSTLFKMRVNYWMWEHRVKIIKAGLSVWEFSVATLTSLSGFRWWKSFSLAVNKSRLMLVCCSCFFSWGSLRHDCPSELISLILQHWGERFWSHLHADVVFKRWESLKKKNDQTSQTSDTVFTTSYQSVASYRFKEILKFNFFKIYN